MFIRCADCRAATWIQPARDGGRRSATCRKCGESFDLGPAARMGASDAERYRRILETAERHQIDVPGACSVLLGLMSVAQARTPPDDLVAEDEAHPNAQARPRKFDPQFLSAVEEGHLTVKQAAERGSRRMWALAVARRHRLPMELAYHVADNRITIRTALSRLGQVHSPADAEPRRRPRVPAAAFFVAAAAVALGIMVVAPRTRGPVEPGLPGSSKGSAQPSRAGSRRVGPAEVRTDAQGRVVEVVAPDPRAVLVGYCKSRQTEVLLVPLEITPTVPPYAGSRMGIFSDFSKSNARFAIRIRKDSRTERWMTGNGKSPVETHDASRLPEPSERVATR